MIKLAPTYTTAVEVALLLGALDGDGARQAFSDSPATMPTLAEVNSLIESKEEVINIKLTRSWKETSAIEYHNHEGFLYDRFGQTSSIIKLAHRDIKALDTSEGDKIEVWDGSTWTDILAEEGDGAGAGSFLVDYANGFIHFYTKAGIRRGVKSIKLTYRYGIATVPKEVSRCCALMVASQLMETEQLLMIPEGDVSTFHLTKRDILWRWDREIKEVLGRYKRFNWF